MAIPTEKHNLRLKYTKKNFFVNQYDVFSSLLFKIKWEDSASQSSFP